MMSECGHCIRFHRICRRKADDRMPENLIKTELPAAQKSAQRVMKKGEVYDRQEQET